LGAFHTGEIPYAFDSLAKLDRAWNGAALHLADTMSWHLFNFAENGNPNEPDLPLWPTYSAEEKPVIKLGSHVQSIPRVLSNAKTEFSDEFFSRTYVQ
jgi:para-nitrobenzyl esterase